MRLVLLFQYLLHSEHQDVMLWFKPAEAVLFITSAAHVEYVIVQAFPILHGKYFLGLDEKIRSFRAIHCF